MEHSERHPEVGPTQPLDALGPETADQCTDNADKSPSVSVVSAQGAGSGLESALGGTAAADRQSLLAADVIAMRLDEFATARLRVEVTSDVLGERVVFASDNTKLDPGEPLVIYRAAELRELVGFSPDDLRKVHAIKKMFGGTIVPS
jgi:hypothetical protein